MSDPEAFFRHLRALRAGAGLSIAELAERAHFPEETLAAAEAGPVVPGNPVLVAYVRGCGGQVGEWEDRWREVSVGTASAGEVLDPVAPRPAIRRRRQVRRVAVAAAAAVLLSAAAIAALGRQAGDGSLGAGRHRPVVPRQRALFREVAGVGCPNIDNDGVAVVAAKPGPPWVAAAGGWTGDGCDGASVWTPDPAVTEPVPPTFTWFFRGVPVSSQCAVSVFVPVRNAFGTGSYAVFAGPRGLRTMTIDQAARAGQWVVLGSFPGSEFEIQLTPGATTLTASDPADRNAAIAASAAAITCSGSA